MQTFVMVEEIQEGKTHIPIATDGMSRTQIIRMDHQMKTCALMNFVQHCRTEEQGGVQGVLDVYLRLIIIPEQIYQLDRYVLR